MKTKLTLLVLLAVAFMVQPAFAATAEIEMTQEAGDTDCVTNENCYTPMYLMIKRGTDIVMKNNDSLPHTVSSGTPFDGPDGAFDSGMILSNSQIIVQGSAFVKDGQFDYFCMVHPWMIGQIDVVKDFYEDSLTISPAWFDQVSQWHKEGKIPDNEYYWAVGYLDDNNLL